MSIELMTQAWKADIPAGRKLVLLSLCDQSNDKGECYPSIAQVARRCGMSERTVQVHLADLQGDGMLRRDRRFGRSNLFTIHADKFLVDNSNRTPQILHPGGADSAPPQILHPADSAPHTADSAPYHPADSAPVTVIETSLKHQSRASARERVVEKILEVGDVEPTVFREFDQLCKRKGKPLTRAAVQKLRGEAGKAGISLGALMRYCTEKRWADFEAAWLNPSSGAAQSTADADSRAAVEAAGEALGVGRWDQTVEQWHQYKARVRSAQPQEA